MKLYAPFKNIYSLFKIKSKDIFFRKFYLQILVVENGALNSILGLFKTYLTH